MTTTVTIKTHDKPAHVRQIVPAAFDGEFETAAKRGLPIPVPPNSEMDFTVHAGADLLVSEGEAPVIGDDA